MILAGTLISIALVLPFVSGTFLSRVKEYYLYGVTGKPQAAPGHIQEHGTAAQIILENVETAHILIDPQLQVVTFNQVAVAFTSATFKKTLEKDTSSLEYFPPDRRDALKAMFLEALRGTDSGYEVEYPGNDGASLWYAVRIRGISQSGRTIGTIMSVRDITEHKLLDLQREKMTADLLQHNRNLEQFSYIVSHNLRAPLANIIGLSQVLTMPGVDDAQKSEFVRHISFSSRKLDEVIIDLNSILHVRNHNDEQKQALTFTSVLEDVKLALKDTVPGLEVHITSDFSQADHIMSVKSYLYSIFYNLVSNSIKYRQHGTEPVISIRSRITDNRLELCFKDNGTGIDMARNADKIFGLYKRFHPHIEGKGMGLYMTRIQVEKLGGTISVESALNEGTAFKIQFS